jgi:protein-tyrosine-phosphatase
LKVVKLEQTMKPTLLFVGGADTGRAPMAAAVLRSLLRKRGLDWTVESAGVLGHDGDPAEPEARDAMAAFNLNIDEHRARSLDDDLVAAATLLLTMDNGTARVLRLRYPAAAEQIVTLGDLAGRQRDIPDPFRMQVGAWIAYAREIEALLRAGLSRLVEHLGDQSNTPPPIASSSEAEAAPPIPPPSAPQAFDAERNAALERCKRLLVLLDEMPNVIDWSNARRQIEIDLQFVGAKPVSAGDLVQSYVAIVLGLLGASATLPTPEQLNVLVLAVERMQVPINQQAITDLSAAVAGWSIR